MSLTLSVLILLVLIVSSAVVSASEISIAGARKVKLQQRANDGDLRALSVLQLHDQPGRFITIVQILSNMVAILGGIVGEAALRPIIADWLSRHTDAPWASSAPPFPPRASPSAAQSPALLPALRPEYGLSPSPAGNVPA